MTEKEDLRTIRTKKLLSQALIDLISKRDIEDICIKDICDKAMIHRTTFYKHFEDKFGLLAYILNNIKLDLFAKTKNYKQEFNTPKELYTTLVMVVLDYIQDNKNTLLAIYKNNKNEIVSNLLFKTMEQSVKFLLEQNTMKDNYIVPTEIITQFYAGGFISLALWWLTNDHKYSKEKLLKYSNTFIDERLNMIYHTKQ